MDRARSRITYAPVSPHIEILIRGNCESLFPSCVPRIRYDATPRHVTPRTSCYRDFLLSRQQKDTKRSETIASEQDLRDYAYILPLFFSSPEENSMGIWRVIGFLAARNSMTLFVPDPPTSQLPSAGRTMRIRWRSFPRNIRREFNRGQISSLIFFKYPRVTFRVFNLSSRLDRFNEDLSVWRTGGVKQGGVTVDFRRFLRDDANETRNELACKRSHFIRKGKRKK